MKEGVACVLVSTVGVASTLVIRNEGRHVSLQHGVSSILPAIFLNLSPTHLQCKSLPLAGLHPLVVQWCVQVMSEILYL